MTVSYTHLVVTPESRVNVQGRRDGGAYARDVRRRLYNVHAGLGGNDQALALCFNGLQEACESLGLDLAQDVYKRQVFDAAVDTSFEYLQFTSFLHFCQATQNRRGNKKTA